ncbi:MAG: hypothetical protein R3B06_01995 [Kofleriaceae bacterium]
MASKRSPILGYNHNVRFRGIVFHIQTEDSGVINPHVFTHLFHGGVILSTRKLVYDPGANDDAVKSLMQAQHKAVMKDLRRGEFDDKIDSYLAGTEGLLPRHLDSSSGMGEPAAGAAPAPADELEALADDDLVADDDAAPQGADGHDSVPTAMDVEADATIPTPMVDPIESLAALDAALESARTFPVLAPVREPAPPTPVPPTPVPPEVGRAPTERLGSRTATLDPALAQIPGERNDVSAAMRAIQVGEAELAAAGLDDVARIHSPAPPSAPTPPGVHPERVGEYQLSRPATQPMQSLPPRTPRPAAAGRSIPPPVPRATPPAVRPPTPLGSRVPTPSTTARVPVIPPPSPRPTPPRQTPRSPTPPSSTIPRPAVTTGPPPRGRPTSGGVVVSRPAVIVGNRPATTPPPTKVRRARESFGGDLISERSLDEVILAYLSEDASED